MTHRGPCQPRPFCDSVTSPCAVSVAAGEQHQPARPKARLRPGDAASPRLRPGSLGKPGGFVIDGDNGGDNVTHQPEKLLLLWETELRKDSYIYTYVFVVRMRINYVRMCKEYVEA